MVYSRSASPASISPSKPHPRASPSPSPSPSPAFPMEEEELLTSSPPAPTNTVRPVVLDSLTAVSNYRLHPSVASSIPVNIILCGHGINESGMRNIAELVWVCRGVTVVDLGCNELGDSECEMLCQALHSPACALYVLSLSGNSIGGDGAAALGSYLARTKTLMELNLRLNIMADVGISALSNGLKRNQSLVKLNLAMNSITPDGVLSLVDALARNTTLRELDLSGNDMKDDGIALLVKAIASTRISTLNINSNDIGTRGAVALSELLQNPACRLTALFIADNSIGDAGAIAIANSLHINDYIRRLDLSNNSISDQGAFAFAHALTMNKVFSYFSIRDNHISLAGTLAIATALQNQPNLYGYNLNGNRLSPMEYRHIMTMLEECWRSQHANHFDNGGPADDVESEANQPTTKSADIDSILANLSISQLFPSPELITQALQFLPHLQYYNNNGSNNNNSNNNINNNVSGSTFTQNNTQEILRKIDASQVTSPEISRHENFESSMESSYGGYNASELAGESYNMGDESDVDVEERLKRAIQTMKNKVTFRNESLSKSKSLLFSSNKIENPMSRSDTAIYHTDTRQDGPDLMRQEREKRDKEREREWERREREEMETREIEREKEKELRAKEKEETRKRENEEREREQELLREREQEIRMREENERDRREKEKEIKREKERMEVIEEEEEKREKEMKEQEEEEEEEPKKDEEEQHAETNIGSGDDVSSANIYQSPSVPLTVSPTMKRVARDAKPFILKRYSLSMSPGLEEIFARSQSPPRTPPLPRSPTPTYLPPASHLSPLSSETTNLPSSTPPLSPSPTMLTLSATPTLHYGDESSDEMGDSPRPSPPASPTTLDDVSRKPRSRQTSRKMSEAAPHGPPLPQITDEDVSTVRQWFIHGPPPFTVNRHFQRKGKKASTTCVLKFDREHLTLTEKRKFGKQKVIKIKLSPELKGTVSMQFPGAFVVESPELKEALTFSSPQQREMILSTLIVFIYGASTLTRNRNM